ncbi:ribosomal protein S18-alanine N-acetyltransferase [Psychrobacter okhotskensis]|uniref:ribosomal protein S18-alanine N-acetyltransferase n=1 Tax=Psychrobacter okhotskensis TaxID=212403 RepID=UPI001563518A|nr:ribosomal protein S18-alanine N-acetyltransferase [Psychrobacter okhotskensis]NRD71591.1 ribosomal protein S18-alanine N-acetyltransferase [Psychrobacter okhotskensis]
MLTLDLLNKQSSKAQSIIQAVEDIETIIQPQDAWGYQTIIELLEQDSIDLLVVYQSDKVVGYCLYQVIFEQAEILRIGTHPDYQRQGIASQLFAKLNTELMNNKVEHLLLEVRADNVAAITLYEQQGLAVIHRRKGYYQIPHHPAIDALIMQRVYL